MSKRLSSLYFAALCLFLAQTLAAQPGSGNVFGPEEFVRGSGTPVLQGRDFSIAGFQPPFILHLRNGDDSGRNRVSSATVTLNGRELFGASDFSQRVSGYDLEVELVEPSRLEVRIASAPGSKLTIWIEGTRATSPFEIDAQPTAFFTDTPTRVRVQVRIQPDPLLDPASLSLLRVDAGLNPIGSPLCNPRDNGNLGNGDDIAGDSVFSCFADFLEPEPGVVRLIVRAVFDGATLASPPFFLDVVEPLSEQDAQTILQVQQQASQIWQQKRNELGDNLAARTATAEAVRALPGVADAGVAADGLTVWILYESGVRGGLMLNPPGTRGGGMGLSGSGAPLSVTRLALADEDTPVENTKVMIWDAYNSEFAPFDEGPDLQQLFQNASCPKFSVTYLIDGQATVDSVRSFTQFGTVILVTHGALDGDGQVVFLTREPTSLFGILGHAIDLLLGRVSILGDVFAIRPGFISSLPGGFENAIVYNGSCESSANATMANAFLGKEAKTYFGYTRVVNSDFAQSTANQLFQALVTDRDNTGEAFNKVTPKVDPTAPNATFTMNGDDKVVYTGDLINGDFEKGNLTGWTKTGDGRVLVALGEFSPPQGDFMGIISTGLGFATDSGTIEQSFCIPADATELRFDWNFSSEEFTEWCGPTHPFDDPFVVELVTDTGTVPLFRQTIDSLCGSVSPTSLHFDQSGPGCTPSGSGPGSGGNDCIVWSTGWRSESIDISGVAASNPGQGVTLRFRNFDAGDSIFDSAVLLDQITVETEP
ncbi:MAG TPA: hypothetical protein VF756_13400 [Thermoanaerobaculia bacterium]